MRKQNHGRGGSRHVGRLRAAAARLLSSGLGYEVRPEEISPATGATRTNLSIDCYRWEVFTMDAGGRSVVLGCWETLTEWVAEAKTRGFHVNSDREICLNSRASIVQGAN